MPNKPKHACAISNCPNLVEWNERVCPAHKETGYIAFVKAGEQRVQFQKMYTERWARTSKAFLVKHPLCAECERQGRVTPATLTDHVIPHRGDYKLFWDHNNWQALCVNCHAVKTADDNKCGSIPLGIATVELHINNNKSNNKVGRIDMTDEELSRLNKKIIREMRKDNG